MRTKFQVLKITRFFYESEGVFGNEVFNLDALLAFLRK